MTTTQNSALAISTTATATTNTVARLAKVAAANETASRNTLEELKATTNASNYARFAEKIASAEGEVEFWNYTEQVASGIVDYFAESDELRRRLEMMHHLLAYAAKGAGDATSGRTNDYKRTANDAMLECIPMIQLLLMRDLH